MVSRTLDEIGVAVGTDKCSQDHDYLVEYERQLAHLRNEAFVLLEIGVRDGRSLRMWEEYFLQAKIVGLDLAAASTEFRSQRIHVEVGNQGDIPFLLEVVSRYRPKVIIDDGSHLWGHQIQTFQYCFPYLAPEGIYICEDLHTSYGALRKKYSHGREDAAAAYFLSLANSLLGRRTAGMPHQRDPFVSYVQKRMRTVTVLQSSVIVSTRS